MIPPTALTADGTSDGIITIANTYSFKVGQCILFKQGATYFKAKIQRVISETQFIVIDMNEPIITKNKLDMSSFSAGATVELSEVKRPVIDILEIQRQVYEEEPTVALRTHAVDWLGRSYDASNPMPVQLSDGSIDIGTVNAELEVQLSHIDNYPDTGDVADSVRVGDGVETLEINPDGSIDVNIIGGGYGDIINIYNEIMSVPAATVSNIVSYTVPAAKEAFLNRVEFTGTNIGAYELLLNGTPIAKRHTWFNGAMSDDISFISSNSSGLELTTGDTVVLRVSHGRPFIGDYAGRIQVVERTP